MMAKLLLVDGMDLFRGLFACLSDEDQVHRATLVATYAQRTLMRCVREQQITHAVIVIEQTEKTWRTHFWPEYNQHRKPLPLALREAMRAILQNLNRAGFRSLYVPDTEARDVLASMAARSAAAGVPALVMSTDATLLALTELPAVQIYSPFKHEIRDKHWVARSFGIAPQWLPDWFALVGSKRLGLPGLIGVGKKIAPELLRTYGSLAGILAAEDIPGKKRRARVAESKADLEDARQTASLQMGIEVGITLRNYRVPSAQRRSRAA